MKCENDKIQLTAYLNNEMTDVECRLFETHLASCPECSAELGSMKQVWSMMGEIPVPEPSSNMAIRFNSMLETYKQAQEEKKNPFAGIMDRLRGLWTLQPGLQIAYSIILIVAGIGLGYLFNRQGPGYANKQQVEALSSQVHEMKEMMMLSLLENPSASERIRGVSYTTEVTGNKEVIDALFTTLNNDPNVNVRLVTLEALTHFTGNPAVREGLVQSIVQQESPLVQSALADAMLKLQEKGSVKAFRKILQQKNLDNSVREKIEKTITKLI